MALAKTLRRWCEWLFGHWYEGPLPPPRLVAQVRVWANAAPQATRQEWVTMAEEAIRVAYEAGWQRGFEHAEREPGMPSPSPEAIADAIDPGWRSGPPLEEVDVLEPNSVPLEIEWKADPPGLTLLQLTRIRRRDGLPL